MVRLGVSGVIGVMFWLVSYRTEKVFLFPLTFELE